MKVHAGIDADSGYVHIITGMSANMHNVSETSKLLREDEVLSKNKFWINKRPSSLKMADNFNDLN